jgi:two-component system sensor histidine kinase KdpD
MANVPKPTEERILVCVSPSPSSAQLIGAASKMATDLHATWSAAYVEQPMMAMRPEAERNRAADNLRLAERLGAETVTLTGRNVADEIIAFARQRNVTKLVVGKPTRPSWRGVLSGSPVDRLVRISRDIDVYVTAGEPVGQREAAYVIRPERIHLSDYGSGVMFLVLATLICFLMYPYFHLSNLIMVYLLGVMLTAIGCGRGPAILMSFLSVLAFDFFFVPPRFSFSVEESEYIVTFVVMALVALVISHLAAGMREQTAIARLQERQAAAMHGLSRQLASARGVEKILQLAVKYIAEIFDCEVSALLPDDNRKLKLAAGDLSAVIQKDITNEVHVAHSAFDSGQMTGWGTKVSPTTEILYVPLRAAETTSGLLALRPRDPGRLLLREQVTLLESLAKQVALALEVERISAHTLGVAPRKAF